MAYGLLTDGVETGCDVSSAPRRDASRLYKASDFESWPIKHNIKHTFKPHIMKKNWILALSFTMLLGSPVVTNATVVPIQTVAKEKKPGWNDVCKQTLAIIAKKGALDQDKLSLKGNLKTDYGLDSLDLVEIVMECEKVFDITIPDAALESDKIYQVEYLVHVIYFDIPHQKVRDCFDDKSWKKSDTCSEAKKR